MVLGHHINRFGDICLQRSIAATLELRTIRTAGTNAVYVPLVRLVHNTEGARGRLAQCLAAHPQGYTPPAPSTWCTVTEMPTGACVNLIYGTGEGAAIGASSTASLPAAREAVVEERKVIMNERTRKEEAEEAKDNAKTRKRPFADVLEGGDVTPILHLFYNFIIQ